MTKGGGRSWLHDIEGAGNTRRQPLKDLKLVGVKFIVVEVQGEHPFNE